MALISNPNSGPVTCTKFSIAKFSATFIGPHEIPIEREKTRHQESLSGEDISFFIRPSHLIDKQILDPRLYQNAILHISS